MSHTTTTIAALATAPQPAGIAVVRVSGPRARTAIHAIFRGRNDPTDRPREMLYGKIIDAESHEEIDAALCVFMPGPHSFTGEDVAEFQFHGSPLLVEKVLRSLFACGMTPAEPGEFTKRAFLNGKLDLIQAEAVADVINATNERALTLASEQLSGHLSSVIDSLGEPLRNILAELEAHIDFPEEDIEPSSLERMRLEIERGRDLMSELLSTFRYGQTVKDGFRVLLCGRPNVGKSSLLNLLLQRERAIVTPIQGTTRDTIEESCNLGGYSFILCDSAGLRDTDDVVEKIGVSLTKAKMDWADLILFITDASDASDEWKEVLEELRGRGKPVWMVTNKIDLNPQAVGALFCDSTVCQQNIYLSAKTKNGFANLVTELIEAVKNTGHASADSSLVITNERQRNCLYQAQQALHRVVEDASLPLEIISENVRVALGSLAELVGKTTTEDILGRIFSKFCIGK
jgi:tRNA modification GTPase